MRCLLARHPVSGGLESVQRQTRELNRVTAPVLWDSGTECHWLTVENGRPVHVHYEPAEVVRRDPVTSHGERAALVTVFAPENVSPTEFSAAESLLPAGR